jgi:NADH:ubiquinone oxidoreductase subunit C
MDLPPALQVALERVQPWAAITSTPESNRLDMVIDRSDLLSAVQALVEPTRWGYLSALTGLDHPGLITTAPSEEKKWDRIEESHEMVGSAQGTLEVLYHFCQGGAIATLRVRLSYQSPSLPSICNLIPYASLYERELMEMFGIEILGTPNTDRLLISDDWPKGVYPLRKEFTGLKPGQD